MIEAIVIYLVIINICAYVAMYTDKKRAQKNLYRIPERTLFMLVIVGGSIGGILGMQQFRHKTKHWYFKYGFPAILVLQLLLVAGASYLVIA